MTFRQVERIFSIQTVPPSVNRLRVFNGRRMITTNNYRKWIEETMEQISSQQGYPRSAEFLWSSDIQFPCSRSRMDIDNVPKAVHDLLVKAEKIPDDRYMVDQRIRWSDVDHIIVTTRNEDVEEYAVMKKMSTALIRRLGGSVA